MRERSFSERRRHRTRLPAHIVVKMIAAGRSVPVLCTIREISPAGAKPELFKSEAIPASFWLKLDGGTYMYQCTVMRTQGLEIGVEIGFEHMSAWWEHSQRAARKVTA